MAVYDQSYAGWEGTRTGRLRSVAALVRPGLSAPFKNVWILIVIIFAFVIVAAWMLFLLAVATQAARNPRVESLSKLFFAVGNNIYRLEFFNNFAFSMVLLVLSIAVGAPLVSRDLRHNALLMVFARPISRWDYVLAKFSTLVLFLLFVTLGPALLLFCGQLGMGLEKLSAGQKLADLLAITLHSLILTVPLSAAVLACSSMTKRAYVAGILWATIFFASTGFSEILSEVLKEDWCGLLSWSRLTAHLGDFCYQERGAASGPRNTHALACGWLPPLAILSGITAASLAFVRYRLRSTEAGE